MLRLLQKRPTGRRLADLKTSEFSAHLFFVLSLHIIVLCIALFSYKKNAFLLVNIKNIQASRNTIVRWTGSKRAQQKQIQSRAITKPTPVKKQAVKKIESKFGGKFTPVNLGPKIKRKNKRVYQLPVSTEVIEKPLEIIPEKTVESPVLPEEPFVLSVHEYTEYQVHKEIVDAVCRWWQLPLGAEAEKNCVIMVKVSESGACQELVVKESSGIPAYDIAAKSAVLKAQFPKIVWGKECVFQF